MPTMTPSFRHIMLRSLAMPARQAEPVTSSSYGASTEGDSEAAVLSKERNSAFAPVLAKPKIASIFYIHVSYGSSSSKPVNISLFIQNGNRIIISARDMLSGLNIVYQLSVSIIFPVLMSNFLLIYSTYAPVNIPWFEGELITLF